MERSVGQFRILGPLEVVDERARAVEIAGRQPRAVLALLLLRANEVVPATRLIDDLWGDEPPEGAAKAVQIYVSRLRKALGNAAALVETLPGGYRIRVDEAQLDLARFERLEREGRRALGEGAAEEAAARFEEALALWRGPPLTEFAHDAFGHEIARLAERRLAAIEQRTDAELALGRHATCVAELGQLVTEHPFRERLRGRLMLALARSGRQADALRVYDEGRRRMVEELGLEPGAELRELQHAILRQDETVLAGPAPAPAPAPPPAPPPAPRPATPAADVVPRERPTPVSPRRRRRHRAAVVGAGLLVALAGAIALMAGGDGGKPLEGEGLAVLDAGAASIADSIDVGRRPGAVAFGLDSVWVASVRDKTISRVDPESRTVGPTIGLGFEPSGLAVGENAVWVADAAEGRLVRFNAVTGEPERTFALGRGGPGPITVAVGAGSVWAANSNAFLVVRIDPRENRVVAEIPVDAPRFVAVGREGVWVVEAASAVRELDLVTNRASTVLTTGFAAGGLALGAGSIWVSRPAEDLVLRFDVATRSFTRTIDVGARPGALAYGSGSLWVANTSDGSVSVVDPKTNTRVDTVELGGRPAGLAAGRGVVWATITPHTFWTRP